MAETVTYAAEHKIKFDNFEFVNLDKMEIKKSIFDHSRVEIRGMVQKKNIDKYKAHLEKEDPAIIITYDNDDRKVLFKGIINDYKFSHEYYDYYLELKAVSYSVLLERERKNNRVFQNQGKSYNEVFSKLSSDNDKFHISFTDSSIGDVPLVSKDYPVVLQYKESEWDFIKRLSSYLNQIVIVDDTKDDSETINIQAGPHQVKAKDLNNVSGMKVKKMGPYNTKYIYCKVNGHEHFRSNNVFSIGKKVNYKLNNDNEDTVELIIIKNRIYMDKGILCSDFTLVKEGDINLFKRKRKKPIEGRSFRAKVKEVNNAYQAKVQFMDIEDDFSKGKAYFFPIDRIYSDAYFAPEKDAVVDVYFKSKNEKYATIKSVSTDGGKEVDNNPEDKVIMTPEGYQIKINNEDIEISSKDKKSLIKINKEEIKVINNDNQVVLNNDAINLKTKKGEVNLDKSITALVFGGKKVEISNKGINMV